MNTSELQTAQALPWYATKWWMRTRVVQAVIIPEPMGELVRMKGIGASAELYCPWWAKPLDWLNAALFGSTKLDPEQSTDDLMREAIQAAKELTVEVKRLRKELEDARHAAVMTVRE